MLPHGDPGVWHFRPLGEQLLPSRGNPPAHTGTSSPPPVPEPAEVEPPAPPVALTSGAPPVSSAAPASPAVPPAPVVWSLELPQAKVTQIALASVAQRNTPTRLYQNGPCWGPALLTPELERCGAAQR